MQSAAMSSRMAKEIRMLQTEPPPGVWAAPKGDKVTELEAQIQGPKDTVYEGGLFSLAVDIPARYPFEPPKVRFVTPIYHPNIDPEGRICLDILNMPPKGAWKPSLNLGTLLASVGLLLAHPNPDDGLVTDITAEFKHQRQVFDAKARQSTQRHAVQGAGAQPPAAAAAAGGEASAPAAAVQQQQQQQQGEPSAERASARAGAAAGAAATTTAAGGQAAAGTVSEDAKENSQPSVPTAKPQQAAPAQDTAQGADKGTATEQQLQPPPPKRSRLGLRK